MIIAHTNENALLNNQLKKSNRTIGKINSQFELFERYKYIFKEFIKELRSIFFQICL